MTLEVNIFHVGKQQLIEKENKCNSNNLFDTLVTEEVYEQLDARSLDPSFHVDVSNFWLYHNTSDSLFSCDDVQVGDVSS